jgi:hypothetical protein
MWWVLILAIALLLFSFQFREHYVTSVQTGASNEIYKSTAGPGERPVKNAVWLSKIHAEAPLGASDDDYMSAIDSFYDTKWKPLRTQNPNAAIEATEVENFLQSGDIPSSVDKNALRRILNAGFDINTGETATAREDKQLVKTGALAGFHGAELQPQTGVDEVRVRTEESYKPSDMRLGQLPEGVYEPSKQQETPRRSGEYSDKSTGWTSDQFYSVCEGKGECSKNVL